MEKLKSRKLWVTIIAGAAVILAREFGIELDGEQLISLGLMVAAYIGGQAVVDRGKVVAEVQEKVPQLVAALNEIAKTLEEDPTVH